MRDREAGLGGHVDRVGADVDLGLGVGAGPEMVAVGERVVDGGGGPVGEVVLAEFGRDALVICFTDIEAAEQRHSLAELLPRPFGPESL